MHLHNCRCFQQLPRMLLQSLRALCKAPGGPGSIWKCLEALVRATGVSGRLAYGFRTDLHFADAALLQFHDDALVLGNHRFPAQAHAGVAWEDFSAAVKEAFIPPDAVPRLTWH